MKYINHRKKYLFPSAIYVFHRKNYVFLWEKYINLPVIYINQREKHLISRPVSKTERVAGFPVRFALALVTTGEEVDDV